jgi:hypothetical protein
MPTVLSVWTFISWAQSVNLSAAQVVYMCMLSVALVSVLRLVPAWVRFLHKSGHIAWWARLGLWHPLAPTGVTVLCTSGRATKLVAVFNTTHCLHLHCALGLSLDVMLFIGCGSIGAYRSSTTFIAPVRKPVSYKVAGGW